jgi:hypothetical protein
MEKPINVRRWLSRQPIPVTIKGEEPDGSERVVELNTHGRYRYSDAASALDGCVRLTACNKDGRVLRVLNLEPEGGEAELSEQKEEKRKASELKEFRLMLATTIPEMVVQVLNASMQLGQAFAAAAIGGNQTAMQALASVVQLQGGINKQSISQILQLQKALADQGPAGGDPTDELALKLLTAQLGGGAAPSNGGGGFQISPEMIQSFLQWQQQQQQGG